MAKHLAIIVDCAPLGPVYRNGSRHIDVALAAAMVATSAGEIAAGDAELCKPWNWTIDAVHVYRRLNANSDFEEVPGTVTLINASQIGSAAELVVRLDAQVRRLFSRAGNDPDLFLRWKIDDGARAPDRPWLPGMLGDASRWPPDLSRKANLSFAVEVLGASIDGYADVVVVPEIEIKDAGRYQPALPIVVEGQLARCPYKPTGAVDVQAYVQPMPVMVGTAADSFIDLAGLWIRAPAPTPSEYAWHGHDVTAEIGVQAAEGLAPGFAAGALVGSAGAGLGDLLGSGRGARWRAHAARRVLYGVTLGATEAADGHSLADIVIEAGLAAMRRLQEASGDAAAFATARAEFLKALRERACRLGKIVFPDTWPANEPDGAVWSDCHEPLLADLATTSGAAVAASARRLTRRITDQFDAGDLASERDDWRRLLTSVGNGDAIRTLVAAQWRRDLPKTGDVAQLSRAIELGLSAEGVGGALILRRLQAAAAGDRLRRVLSLRLGKLSAGQVDPRETFIKDYKTAVLDQAVALLRIDRLPEDGSINIPDAAKQAIDELAGNHASERVLPAENLRPAGGRLADEIGDDSPTAAPHVLTIVIDDLRDQAAQDPTPDKPYSDADLYRRIAGVGIFIRQLKADSDPLDQQAAFETWRCLNLANLFIRPADAEMQWSPTLDQVTADTLVERVFVPYVMGFQGGTSQPIVGYDSEALVAEDPFAAANPFGDGSAPDPLEIPMLRYGPALDNNGGIDPRAQLPALRFGQVYDVAGCVAANGGALPCQLVTDGDPAKLRTDLTVDPPAASCRRYRYLRRVRVGEPRLLAPDATAGFDAVKWRQGGKDVRPLADEIEHPGRAAGLDARHKARFYFADDFGQRGEIDLAWLPAGMAEPGFGWETLAIDSTDLGDAAFWMELVETPAQPDSIALIAVKFWRTGRIARIQLHVRDAAGTLVPQGEASEITLPDFAAVSGARALADVILNPPAGRYPGDGADGWRLLLRAGGTTFWDRATGQEAVVQVTSLPVPPIDAHQHAWRQLALRYRLDGDTAAIAFGRPTLRVGQELRPADLKPDVPLLLMSKSAATTLPSEIRLEVALPSADLGTWYRWGDMDRFRPEGVPALSKNDDDRRRHAVETTGTGGDSFSRLIHVRIDLESQLTNQATIDLTLDDPAVSLKLLAHLVPLHAVSGPGPALSRVIEVRGPSSADSDVASVRCERAKLAIRAADSPSISAEGDGWVVTVPEGEVWELQIESLVHAGWFLSADDTAFKWARMPDRVRDGLPTWTDDGATYVRMSPARLRIEAAALEMPAPALIHELLSPAFDGTALVASWKPDQRRPLSDLVKVLRLGAVDLLRQAWRWEGRSIAPVLQVIDDERAKANQSRLGSEAALLAELYSLGAGAIDVDCHLLLWESWVLADRDPADLHRSRIAIAAPPRATQLFHRDLAQDPRASYHRFAAIAISRYAAVIKPDAGDVADAARLGVLGAGPAPACPAPSRPRTHIWRRQLVPSRVSGDLPKPAVKLVVPLTSSGGDGEAGGFLLILDEPWYEHGGIGERIDARIERVEHDDLKGKEGWPDDQPTRRLEAAPDPVISSEVFPVSDDVTLALDVDGPIGHTRDELAQTIKSFPSCSFVISPKFTGIDGRLLGWSFVKLAFRRALPAAARAPAGDPGRVDAVSAWTIAQWHQLLPDWSRFRLVGPGGKPTAETPNERIDADKAPLTLSCVAGRLQFRRSGQEVVPWPAASAGFARFGLWVLITRRVYSTAGLLEGERYLGLYEYQEAHGYSPVHGATVLADDSAEQGYVARLIELQFRGDDYVKPGDGIALYPPVPRTGTDAWATLIPSQDADAALESDTVARIVRVSPPIKSGNA